MAVSSTFANSGVGGRKEKKLSEPTANFEALDGTLVAIKNTAKTTITQLRPLNFNRSENWGEVLI